MRKKDKQEDKKYLYVVQKTVMARSIVEALLLEKNIKPNDVFIDGDWKKNNL